MQGLKQAIIDGDKEKALQLVAHAEAAVTLLEKMIEERTKPNQYSSELSQQIAAYEVECAIHNDADRYCKACRGIGSV